VLRKHRRDLALDRLQLIVRVRAGEVEEHIGDAPQRCAAQFERVDGVRESRCFRALRDSGDFVSMLGQGRVKGRPKVLRANVSERGCAEGRRPRPAEWIFRGRRRAFASGAFSHGRLCEKNGVRHLW
jgi:hypothetical protein